ncbi:MAG: 16S rRNA (cytosine(1402)-N(4))-methyltransferase RsmH [bacterium]|nr:16S rRNA (cytosine(1402)-N(4))-methyltransferase RsmH [bacterium]
MHIPVLLNDVLSFLNIKDGGVYVDCTLGMGGHTKAILERCDKVKVYGIDRDLESLEHAKLLLKNFNNRIDFLWSNFSEVDKLIPKRVDGVLLDLGISSAQLDRPERGFSYRNDGPLDMRINRQSGVPVFKLLEKLTTDDIEFILKTYGEERWSRRIARGIVESKPCTTQELRHIVAELTPWKGRDRVLARVFQALRIFVNDELSHLKEGLISACKILKPKGRVCVISYHSLEDRIVKQYLRTEPSLLVLTKKPIRPSNAEISINPRARSAKLRVAEKK